MREVLGVIRSVIGDLGLWVVGLDSLIIQNRAQGSPYSGIGITNQPGQPKDTCEGIIRR